MTPEQCMRYVADERLHLYLAYIMPVFVGAIALVLIVQRIRTGRWL